MNFKQLLNYNTIHVRDVNYDALSFQKVVENYLDLTPTVAERSNYILKKTWNARTQLFHNIGYENVILGITLYAIDEFYDRIDADNTMQTNSIAKFVEHLYGTNLKSNLIQIYHVTSVIKIIVEPQAS